MTDAALPRADRLSALRRQIILEAAERVFARDGLEHTTIRAIAKEAGCTTGAIYPCFDGKEAIYGELLRASLTRLLAHLDQQSRQAPAPLAARAAIEAFFSYYAARETEFSLGLYLYRACSPGGWAGKSTSPSTRCCVRPSAASAPGWLQARAGTPHAFTSKK